jgi:transcription initiation factor TFIID TATA-box-binding protein
MLFKNYINTEMVRVRIENVVASTTLGASLDLHAIAAALEGAEYEPAQFPGLIYRLKDPPTAVLLFHSGKAVCTGGKSRKQVDDTLRIVSGLIRKTGQKILLHPKTQIQNIVATADLGSALNLNSVAVTVGLERVEYEPEQFPGLICRLDQPRVVMLLFGSGKLVCTGARRPSDVHRAVQKMTKELQDADLLLRDREPAEPARVRSSRGSDPRAPIRAHPSASLEPGSDSLTPPVVA